MAKHFQREMSPEGGMGHTPGTFAYEWQIKRAHHELKPDKV
jgi:hypothetical protein